MADYFKSSYVGRMQAEHEIDNLSIEVLRKQNKELRRVNEALLREVHAIRFTKCSIGTQTEPSQ